MTTLIAARLEIFRGETDREQFPVKTHSFLLANDSEPTAHE